MEPCKFCKKTDNQHMNRCPTTGFEICDKIADIPSYWIDILQIKIPINTYTDQYVGQGCAYYIRNNNNNLEIIFMHCDSWGQYGDEFSDGPRFNAFIDGYTKIDNYN